MTINLYDLLKFKLEVDSSYSQHLNNEVEKENDILRHQNKSIRKDVLSLDSLDSFYREEFDKISTTDSSLSLVEKDTSDISIENFIVNAFSSYGKISPSRLKIKVKESFLTKEINSEKLRKSIYLVSDLLMYLSFDRGVVNVENFSDGVSLVLSFSKCFELEKLKSDTILDFREKLSSMHRFNEFDDGVKNVFISLYVPVSTRERGKVVNKFSLSEL